MELPSEILLWLGPTLTKRAESQIPANPIQSLIDALEALRLAKYLISEFSDGLLFSLRLQTVNQAAVLTFLIYDIGKELYALKS
jgi:hypothetical protein